MFKQTNVCKNSTLQVLSWSFGNQATMTYFNCFGGNKKFNVFLYFSKQPKSKAFEIMSQILNYEWIICPKYQTVKVSRQHVMCKKSNTNSMAGLERVQLSFLQMICFWLRKILFNRYSNLTTSNVHLLVHTSICQSVQSIYEIIVCDSWRWYMKV